MAVRLSSALRTSFITNYGLGVLLQGGHIRLYSGAQPADGDAAQAGTLLGRITTDGLAAPTTGSPAGGLQLQGGPEAGTLVDAGNWVITGVAAGTVGWARFVALDHDAAGASTTAMRVDFGAADLFEPGEIPTTTNGGTAPLASFKLTIPATT